MGIIPSGGRVRFAVYAFAHFCKELLVLTGVSSTIINGDTGKVAAVEQELDLPTILLVQDDQSILEMVEEALTRGGFQVAIATSVEEALALLKGETPAHRALVTDIHLGGEMDGWDVARIAREIEPGLPVIYMTGAAAKEWPSKGVPQSVLLTKPFAPAELVTAVAKLFNADNRP